MEGKYKAICELYKTVPSMVPKPYTWGKFQLQGVDFYFFLCDCVDMRNQLPDPMQLGKRLADFHRASVSHTGKFFTMENSHNMSIGIATGPPFYQTAGGCIAS